MRVTGARRLAITTFALLAWAAATAATAAAGPGPPPNIVVVMTDDQWLSSLEENTMPRTQAVIGAKGATFSEAVVTTPLCCPSRATFLTGQYGHNNGVLTNFPGYGALENPGNVLPAWLQRAGYHTAHVGKWLNNYGGAVGSPEKVAPGWDQWHTIVSDNDENLRYYNYRLRVNGDSVEFGRADDDHLSRVIADRSVLMLRRYLPRRKPLYLQVDHLAPHTSPDPRLPCRRAAKPEPRDVGRFDDRDLGAAPAFNEADTSDKNSGVAQRPLLDEERIAEMTRKYRCALASLVSVDRSTERIVKTVRRKRELSNTVFVFTSDNGYFYGEHRLSQKSLPYEEAARVPLMVRLPDKLRACAPVGTVIDEPVANIDLTPTLLEIAGALPCRPVGCRTLDGRSLMPLLRDDPGAWPNNRAIGIELRRRAEGLTASEQLLCSYRGLRTPDLAYFEFFNGATDGALCPAETTPNAETESYDLDADAFQLEADGFHSQTADRVRDLSVCAGIQGRDPLPPSGHFCE